MSTVVLSLLLLLLALSACTEALSHEEACVQCSLALRTVYSHFTGAVPSRIKLLHQLKHECKRMPAYRRRCLLLVKPNLEQIYRHMTSPPFNQIQTCSEIKECATAGDSTPAAVGLLLSVSHNDTAMLERNVEELDSRPPLHMQV